jgi:hypothetical protein
MSGKAMIIMGLHWLALTVYLMTLDISLYVAIRILALMLFLLTPPI